ncbi:hypothetical protein SLA2020_119370 [Shorea laevis]
MAFKIFPPSFRELSAQRTYQPFLDSLCQTPSLSLLADKCTSLSQLKQIHARMIIFSRIHDHFAASRLLSFCALSETGDLHYATKLFNNTQNPNLFMWNTLIRGHANSQIPERAVFLYVQMRKLGVVPNNHTLPFLLKACSNCGCSESCKQVHTHVFKFGLVLELHVVNALMRGYCVSTDLEGARQLFDEMQERNLITWTTMISGYVQNFCADEGLVLFNKMILEDFEPNGATFASVLSACADSGCLELGERIHGFIKAKKIEIGVILGTALVHMYAKNGAVMKAKTLFDKMPQRNTATWNVMICGLAGHGHAQEALTLFQELDKGQITPNDITFVGVLSACCHAGLIDVGREIFNSMERFYGVKPKIEHYGCMVDLLGRGGKVAEAEELINEMTWKADVVILGALLAACKNHGNIEVAERVVRDIQALEPDNHGAYVVLAGMYAEAGRWEDVRGLRTTMRRAKLKKTPGWSMADVDN